MKIIEMGNTYQYTIETKVPVAVNSEVTKTLRIGVEVIDNSHITVRPNAKGALDFVFMDSDPVVVRAVGEMLVAAAGLIK